MAFGDKSKATVVSICPFPVHSKKPGLSPGEWNIPASVKGEPVVIVVGGSTFPVYLDADRGSLRVPAVSNTVAESIVYDYVTTHLGYDENAQPGLFTVEGEFTVEQIKAKFGEQLALAKAKQDNWFRNLVKIADDEWNRTHRHAAISDMQRIACKNLGYEREWLMSIPVQVVTNNCPVCSTVITGDPIICPTCKFVRKPAEYDKLKTQFANV